MTCPTCGSARTDVCESRLCINGTRRRRLACLDCEHRWSTWDGPKPPRGGHGLRKRTPPTRKRGPLSEEQVRQILTQDELNNVEISQLVGCSRETVRQIRAGLIYRVVHPELLRPGANRDMPPLIIDGLNCYDCVNWAGSRCNFGFPDPLIEGLTFAADCDLYESVSQSISLA